MKRVITILSTLACAPFLQAQNLSPTVIASTGGYSASASGSISFTAGETITPTLNNTIHILTQGFQQPDKDVTASVEEAPTWSAEAFPNPTQDFLNIRILSGTADEYTWEIRDLKGSILQQSSAPQWVEGETTLQIQVSELAASTYFFLLQNKQSKPYVVKFIKN